MALSAEAIEQGLETAFVGRNLVYLPEVGSTNDVARALARDGAPEGTVVVADHQTAGRGRLRRRWQAPPGSSLLLSLLFRPALAPHQIQRLTMLTSLAVAEAVEGQTGLRVELKWPNDVLAGGAKLAGILTEVELEGAGVAYAVVGVGLNVNLRREALPPDLLMPAISLSEALGQSVARLPLLLALLAALERRYVDLRQGHSPQAEWAGRLVTLGQWVVVRGVGRSLEGRAEGVDGDGALLLRLADGRQERILAGDVTTRPLERPAAA